MEQDPGRQGQVAELTEDGGGPPQPGSRGGSQKGVEAGPCAGFLRSSGLVASVYLGGGKLVDTKRRNHPGGESVGAQSCLTVCDPMVYLPGSSVHGILQARTLQWVAMPFSRASPRPWDQTQVSCTQASSFLTEPQGKPHNPGRSRDRLKSQELAFLGEPGTFLPSLSS